MSDVAESGYNKGDGVGTGAGTMDNANEPKGAEGKIDITTPNKTNKTLILVSY